MKQENITFTVYVHIYQGKVDDPRLLESSIKATCLSKDHTETWDSHWMNIFGKLLTVIPVVKVLKVDLVGGAVEKLQSEITCIEAEAFRQVKLRKDKINDLLYLEYDVGSAKEVPHDHSATEAYVGQRESAQSEAPDDDISF